MEENDPLRQKSRTNSRLQFSFKETRKRPNIKTYYDYVANGNLASPTNPVEGVKGVWCLKILPYAERIQKTVDKMHTDYNIIKDILKQLRPTSSGSSSFSSHTNRILTKSVKEACADEGIFKNLVEGDESAFFLTKKECIAMDECMTRIIGCHSSEEAPRDIMKKGKGRCSHDTTYWAMTWANWCMTSVKDSLRISRDILHNVAHIFNILITLNANQLNISGMDDFMGIVERCIVERVGLVPPSEATITLHELWHVCDQVTSQGVPRRSTLYKFERMNHFLKGLMKNQAAGMQVSNLCCFVFILYAYMCVALSSFCKYDMCCCV